MENSIAKLLELYGGWGLSAVLMSVLWRLVRYVEKMHREQKEEAAKERDSQRDETREAVSALVEVKNAMVGFREAMDRLTVRLDKLED